MNTVKTLLLATALSSSIPFAVSQEIDEDMSNNTTKSEHCLSSNRIRNNEILDSSHIIFEISSSKKYLNTLPNACPGLKKGSTIMYRTSINKLCDLDIITILNSTGGGYMPGASCGLGQFVPISNAEIDALKKKLKEDKK